MRYVGQRGDASLGAMCGRYRVHPLDADPESDPNAEFIDKISYLEVMTRELGVMDAAAISLCKENELPLVVLNIKRPGAILAALKGEKIGTLVA